MKRKPVALCLVLLLVLSLLAGCGGTASDKPSTSGDKTPVTLTFRSYFVQGDNAEAPALAYRQRIDQFLSDNPHVTLKEEILAHDAYETKMMAEAASNALPDMFQLKANWMATLLDNQLIGEMNGFLDADAAWAEGFLEGCFDEFTADGKIYGIPYNMATATNLFYNKTIFDEVGLTTFPQNMSEFEAAIQTLVSNGYIPITAGNKDGWFIDVCFFRQIVDRYCGPDWSRSITENGGAKFTDPEFIAALTQMQRFVELNAFNPDINSLDYMQGRDHFYQGKAAMLFDGSGGILPYTQEAPQEILDAMEVTAMPPLDQGNKSSGIPGTTGWSIGYFSGIDEEKLPTVEAILHEIGSSEFANIVSENSGNAVYKTTDYDTSKLPVLMTKYNELMETVPMTYLGTWSPAVLDVLYTGLQQILIGQTTPEDLANRLQTAYEEQ